MIRQLLRLTALLLLCAFSTAQEPKAPSTGSRPQHKFWDRENRLLFATHAGLEAADFSLTHRALSHGSIELNPIARPFTNLGSGGQIAFFAGGTAAALGIS